MCIPSHCVKSIRNKLIVFEEKGKKIVFLNPDQISLERLKLDGCICVQETSSDFAISSRRTAFAIIELKGKNVERAIEQVNCSAEKLYSMFGRRIYLGGYAIVSSVPKMTTKMQVAEYAFKKKYQGSLKIKCKELHLDIRDALNL